MGKNWRYMELSKILHLRNEGRELLGKHLYFTEKRDGSCFAIWLKLLPSWKRILNKILRKRFDNIPDPCKYQVMVSSRNMEIAQKLIRGDFHRCGDNVAVLAYLNDNPTHIVFGELLRKGLSPTRIEDHKKVEFIVFDIFDTMTRYTTKKPYGFLSYQQVHQECYHYNMKCVKLFGEGRFRSMKSLLKYRDKMLEMCKEEEREGVVIKTFQEGGKPLYAKEKLDIAKSRGKPKLERGQPELPPLPFSEAVGAVDKAYADLGENFSDKKKAMPLVARYIQHEMEKHICSKPVENFYNLYREYCKDHDITVETKTDWKADPEIGMIIDNPLDTSIRNFIKKIKRWLRRK